MKLQEVVSKLKEAKLKVVDFQIHDLDRAGDLFLALALALTATAVVIAQLHGTGHGAVPAFTGRLVYM